MAIIRECDCCSKIDREYREGENLCDHCQQMVDDHRAKAFIEMKGVFGAHIAARVSVVSLLNYLLEEKPDVFREHYGTEGEELLRTALKEIAEKTNELDDA